MQTVQYLERLIAIFEESESSPAEDQLERWLGVPSARRFLQFYSKNNAFLILV